MSLKREVNNHDEPALPNPLPSALSRKGSLRKLPSSRVLFKKSNEEEEVTTPKTVSSFDDVEDRAAALIDQGIHSQVIFKLSFLTHLYFMHIYMYLANQLSAINLCEEAISLLKQALSICLPIYGDSNLRIAMIEQLIGNNYNKINNCAKALKHYERSLEVLRRVHGPYHSDIVRNLDFIIAMHYRLENNELALLRFNESRVIQLTIDNCTGMFIHYIYIYMLYTYILFMHV